MLWAWLADTLALIGFQRLAKDVPREAGQAHVSATLPDDEYRCDCTVFGWQRMACHDLLECHSRMICINYSAFSPTTFQQQHLTIIIDGHIVLEYALKRQVNKLGIVCRAVGRTQCKPPRLIGSPLTLHETTGVRTPGCMQKVIHRIKIWTNHQTRNFESLTVETYKRAPPKVIVKTLLETCRSRIDCVLYCSTGHLR